ncbi:MAG TPA: BatD family protein, partial [Cytophagaceae bacterium]
MKYKIFIIYFILIAAIQAAAQDATFTAQVSKNTVGMNEQFEVSFTLNGNGKTFQPPSFRDFHVIMGPNQSSSMEFINGNMSQSISFSYVLQPKAEGTFKIGSAIIDAGKTLKTNPITITVTKAGSNSSQGQNRNGESAADDASQNLSSNIFIKANINKNNVYRGEALVVTYKLYTRISIVSFAPIKTPTFNGFWNQDIVLPKETGLHKETLNGVEYNVAEIKKTVLFPQRSGTLVIDPLEAESVVRVKGKRKSKSNDPFDDFFNDPFFGSPYQDYKQMLKSDPVKITVKDLPSGEPEGFTGAVGNYSMEARLDRQTTKSNEPVTLKIKISGKGNLKLIEPFKLQFPPDIETYDPKITEDIKVTENGASGSKTFEYLLIPRHAGEYNLKPFNFSYFNVEKKNYTSLPSPEFVLKVEKGNEDNSI